MTTPRLDSTTLKLAYATGYFPMAEPDTNDIYWYNPDPRAILPLNNFHCSRSLRRSLRHGGFNVTFDQDFLGVMHGCANRPQTWINDEFLRAYENLYREGAAHSVEVWRNGKLCGGTYGVALGGAFFAESKFHTVTDASKVALYHLVEHLRQGGFMLLEVQFLTPHLASLGAIQIPARDYMERLQAALKAPAHW